jgi:hypothetical protein
MMGSTREVSGMAAKSLGGRPKEKLEPAERVHLGFRVTPEMKERVELAAKVKGRSQSQQAEMLIEYALDRQDLLSGVLRLAYGPDLAAVLIMLGDAMKIVGEKGGFYTNPTPEGTQNWLNIPFAFDQAAKAAKYVLEVLRPQGEIEMPAAASLEDETNPNLVELDRPRLFSHLYRTLSLVVLRGAVRADDRAAPEFGVHAEEIRELLRPELRKRIKQSPEIAALLKSKK